MPAKSKSQQMAAGAALADFERAVMQRDRQRILIGAPQFLEQKLGLIEREINGLGFVTVTDARVTNDLHDATVFYTVMGPTLDVEPDYEAAAAGLEPGDRVVSASGVAVTSWAQLTDAIRASAGQELPLVVERDGRQLELTAHPVLRERPVVQDGRVLERDGRPVLQEVGYLGASPASEQVRQPVSEVPAVVGIRINGGLGTRRVSTPSNS